MGIDCFRLFIQWEPLQKERLLEKDRSRGKVRSSCLLTLTVMRSLIHFDRSQSIDSAADKPFSDISDALRYGDICAYAACHVCGAG